MTVTPIPPEGNSDTETDSDTEGDAKGNAVLRQMELQTERKTRIWVFDLTDAARIGALWQLSSGSCWADRASVRRARVGAT